MNGIEEAQLLKNIEELVLYAKLRGHPRFTVFDKLWPVLVKAAFINGEMRYDSALDALHWHGVEIVRHRRARRARQARDSKSLL